MAKIKLPHKIFNEDLAFNSHCTEVADLFFFLTIFSSSNSRSATVPTACRRSYHYKIRCGEEVQGRLGVRGSWSAGLCFREVVTVGDGPQKRRDLSIDLVSRRHVSE